MSATARRPFAPLPAPAALLAPGVLAVCFAVAIAATTAFAQPAGGDSIPAAAAAESPIAAADSVAPPATDYDVFFRAFLAQRPDSTRVAHVTRLTLERDAGRFTLEEGDLWLCSPVGGRVCAAVFVGRGSFALTPPTAIERSQLERIYGKPTMERAFSALVLIFADTTLAELSRSLSFQRGHGSRVGNVMLSECLRYVSDMKSRWMDAGLAKPFLEGRANGYLLSLIESVGAERLFFEIDPHSGEEVILWREPKSRHIGAWRVWRRDDVCRFRRGGATEPAPEGDTRPALAVKRYRLECRIGENLDFSATAELECESLEPAIQHWATFRLYDKLDVDSVEWVGGRAARFFKGRESAQLWVFCEPPLGPGETRTLRLHYHGELIERVGDWMFVRSSIDWYPHQDGRRRAPFDLTFNSPSQYHLVSVGERVSFETRGRVTTSRWLSERPIRNASFVLGLFDEESFGVAGSPPVTALMFRGKPDPVRVSFGEVQVVSGARMDKKVATDAGRAVAFFQRALGPPPAGRIIVAEIPDTGGEAFPGLIQITWTPFWGRNVVAEDAVFRAHEVAHQWWGDGVDYRTYHDQWLTEGFADFSALWYVQQGLGDTKSYLAMLEAWRDEILEDKRYRPAGSHAAGPIWLGYRSASTEVPGDHALIVYKKGAWVLHMLRNMLLDSKSMDDEKFASLMRDFYARYAGESASTEDFRRVAQRYADEDLGWFFDQWVYGTAVPTYRFASRTERTPEGKYKVTCRVEQRDVPADFRMPVPIRIDFEGERFTWARILVQSPTAEFELPLMDLAPKAIVFNDLESVLCRVEQVKW
jgi:hypothetical protein